MAGHTSWKKLRAEMLAKSGAQERYERTKHRLDFSLLVCEARTAAGLSQSELARRMGTNQAAIARLESGRTDPKLSTIDRLNRALGTELVIEFRQPAAALQG